MSARIKATRRAGQPRSRPSAHGAPGTQQRRSVRGTQQQRRSVRGTQQRHSGRRLAGGGPTSPSSSPSRKATPAKPKASPAEVIAKKLAKCKQFVKECTDKLEKRGFMELYEEFEHTMESSGSGYSGPLCMTIRIHLSGDEGGGIAADVYDRVAEDSDIEVSKKDWLVPKGEDRALLDVLVWANVGAENQELADSM